MLDYAANGVRNWPPGELQEMFTKTCENAHGDAGTVLEPVIGEAGDVGKFWERTEENLRAGRVRLVFVADVVPSELLTIIEFLNARMTDVEVFGVEVRRYASEGGEEILVPRLMGASAQVGPTKPSSAPLETKLKEAGPDVEALAERLRALAERLGVRARLGSSSGGREAPRWAGRHRRQGRSPGAAEPPMQGRARAVGQVRAAR